MIYCKLNGRFILRICFFLVLAGGAAWGQAKPKNATAPPLTPEINLLQGTPFEVTPHTGAMRGSGLFGLKLAMNYGTVYLEASLAQVIGESADLYPLAINLGWNLTTRGRLLPYGTAGGGLLLTVPTAAVGARSVSTMSANFGGGIRYYFNGAVGLRLEARQLVTRVRNQFESRSELLFFPQVSVGATFMFR